MRMRLAVACGAVMFAAATAAPASAQTAAFDRFTYSGHSQEAAKPARDQYLNPILAGYYPDPAITRVGDDYYLVNSSFSHFPGIPVFHSRDMVHWTQIGNAISRPEQLKFDGLAVSEGVFAPDISYHAGTFYIINTCIGCRGNFVITARDPAGPWSDPVWLDFEGIDPSIFWEGDTAYVVNNGAPNEPARYDGHRAIWVQEFDWKALKLVGRREQLVNGGVDISKKPIWIEGPHMFKRGKFYYLTAAEGGTGDQHSQVVLRGGSPFGPFVPFAGNPILTQRTLDPARPHPVTSAGHADILQTQDGSWWATFLATRPYAGGKYTIGRETFLLPVTWTDDWPTILAPNTPIPFTVRRPALPAQPAPRLPVNGDFGYADEFNGNRLSMQWIGIRTPHAPLYSLSGGQLVLKSGAALGDRTGVPGFVGRRLQHHVADIGTVVRFAPSAEGDRAGLAAVQNDESLLFFGITLLNGKRSVALYIRDKAKSDTLVAAAPLPGTGPTTLTLHMDGGRMRFDYAVAGKTLTLARDVDTTVLSTERAGGFVGTVVGPYVHSSK